MLIFTTNKKWLRRHFEKDRVLFGYHLGDLDDFYFNDCQWAACFNEKGRIDETILIYTALAIPTVLAFGLGRRFKDLLAETLDLLPERFHCHYQADSRALLQTRYQERHLGTHIKMKLQEFRRPDSLPKQGEIVRLGEADEKELAELYQAAYPENYFTARMLQTGKYFGYRIDDRIVAVSGVHVLSDKDDIAILGNIATTVEHRGNGYGTAVTARLVAELVEEDKQVGLNVKADNKSAISCYRKLGFVEVHQYLEGLFESG